jgi:uncharacterized protein (DUF488 family)
MSSLTVWTVGHGAKPLGALIETLTGAAIQTLVDVRRFPGSRRHPHFSRAALEESLPAAGITYRWWGEDLGGRRSTSPASRHPAWRQPAFRGYADHMESESFRAAIVELESAARERPVAIMCAETLWWRCHRRLIADALVGRGHVVVHLMGDGKEAPHPHNEAMRIVDGWPVYDVGIESPLF